LWSLRSRKQPKRAILEFGITEPERQKRLAAYRVA
jgi:hypothetical protein